MSAGTQHARPLGDGLPCYLLDDRERDPIHLTRTRERPVPPLAAIQTRTVENIPRYFFIVADLAAGAPQLAHIDHARGYSRREMDTPHARIEWTPGYELDGPLPTVRGEHAHLPVLGMKGRAPRWTLDELM